MRQHVEHLLAALGALGFALFISYFNTGAVVHLPSASHSANTLRSVPEPVGLATSSIPSLLIGTSTLEALFPSHPAASTSTPVAPSKPRATVKVPYAAPKTAPKAAVPAPVVVPAAPTAPAPTEEPTSTPATDEGVLATLKNSIVNILCIAHDGRLRSVSGSGVIIDSRGIILTVSHVAQATLLQQYRGTDKVSCVIRMGSPAKTAYIARPIYVSDPWIKANATTLISSQPHGTGEYDYALLAITDTATGKPLPGAYPAVPLAGGQPHIGDTVYIGSYGAQDLTSAQVRSSLTPTLVTSTIKDRFTFDTNTLDVLAISGSQASQEGSSGGAVLNQDGELVGVITTSQTTGDYSSREMRSITTGYIRRSYADVTGKNFDDYFGNTSLETLVNVFAPTAVTLGEYLAHAIGLQ